MDGCHRPRRDQLKVTFNILAICGTACFSGVMLCIGVTLGAYWRGLPAQEFLAWFEINNGLVARSIPLTVVPALIGLAGSVAMAWGTSRLPLWILSTLCMAVVIALTFTYFVPTNTAFSTGVIAVDSVPEKLNQWLTMHYARIGFALSGAVFGCLALRG